MLNNNRNFTLITALIAEIFKAEDRRLEKEALSFVSENRKLVPDAHDGFLYKGVFFSDLEIKLRAKGTKGKVHPSLVPTLDRHFADRKQVTFDKDRVKQALAIVINGCKTTQDIRDTLPNCLSEVFDQTRNLPRQREEAFTVRDNPRAYRQFQKLKELIEFYMVTKLLY